MNGSKYKPDETRIIIYLTVIYIIGVTGMLTPGTLDIFMFLVPVNIALAAIVAFIYHEKWSRGFILSCLVIYIGGFVIEWLGVKTGVIFGSYVYGEGLGLKLSDVPVIMGINWLLMVYSSLVIAGHYFRNKLVIVTLAAGLMLLYDVFLEPSAIRYGFWAWEKETVPLQNYLAWFIGGFLFNALYILVNKVPPKNKVAEALFWLQLGFFACLLIGKNLGAGLPF